MIVVVRLLVRQGSEKGRGAGRATGSPSLLATPARRAPSSRPQECRHRPTWNPPAATRRTGAGRTCAAGRRAAAVVALLAAVAAVLGLAAAAPSAGATVWTAPAQARIMPATPPSSSLAIDLSAAGNEYEGAFIGLRGGGAPHDVVVTWSSGSDPLLVQNAELDQVMFVKVSRPTTHLGSKAGLYPDPLVPRDFGQRISVPAYSSSLYVLFHVPYGTAAGTYRGSLHVANGDETAELPVSVRVWPFGWQRLSTHTAFMTNMRDLQTSLQGSGAALVRHGPADGGHQLLPHDAAARPDAAHAQRACRPRRRGRLLQRRPVPAEHRALPRSRTASTCPTPRCPGTAGSRTRRGARIRPARRSSPTSTNLCRFYADNGWQSKAYGFIVDEPSSTAEERLAERYRARCCTRPRRRPASGPGSC